MNTDTRGRIAVVGAGVAGLTAAHRLRRAGAEVVVLEERTQVGGRTHTDVVDGYRIDSGAQLLGSMYERTRALLRELGIGDQLVRAPGRDAVWRNGRVHEVVYGSVTSMLASGGLPMGTKLRLGSSYVPFLTRHAGALDLQAPERAAYAGLDSESIASWGARELDREFVEYLVYPQLAAFYGSTPEQTSAGFYHILARYGLDVAVYALRGGIGTLARTLAAQVEAGGGQVRTGVAVQTMEAGTDGVRVVGEGWEERFDGAVVAVPAPRAAKLLLNPPPPMADWLAHVRYRPALTLALLLDRPLGVRYFGLSLPREASSVVAAACVEESKGGDLVPAGRGLVVAYAAPDSAAELIERDAGEVMERMLPELARAMPGLERRVVRARVYRWTHGNPVFYPGYLGRLGAFRGGGVEGEGRIALAGDYLYSPTVEGAVASGGAAAERLLGRLGARPSI